MAANAADPTKFDDREMASPGVAYFDQAYEARSNLAWPSHCNAPEHNTTDHRQSGISGRFIKVLVERQQNAALARRPSQHVGVA
jgi:hypothetical protein